MTKPGNSEVYFSDDTAPPTPVPAQLPVHEGQFNNPALAYGAALASRIGMYEVLPTKMELGFVMWEPIRGNRSLWRGIIGELVGMNMFLFTSIGMVILLDENNEYQVETGIMNSATRNTVAWTFGLSIFVLVYCFGEVSGAHFNPAVSLCLCIGKRITVLRCVCYTLAQMVGGTLGVAFVKALSPSLYDGTGKGINAIADDFTKDGTILSEMLMTMILCLTVLFATNTANRQANKHTEALLPWAIGMAVTLAHFVLVPLDGCSINPARSFAAAGVAGEWKDQWIFWFGPYLGAVGSVLLFECILKP